jgi:hypothetical protein
MTPEEVHCGWSEVKGVIFSKIYPVVNVLPWWVARAP